MSITRVTCALLLIVFGYVCRADARKLQVAVPGFSQNMAFSAAKLSGYYQAEDLDVEFILMSAGTAVQAVIGGSVDFALVGGAAVHRCFAERRYASFSLPFTGRFISCMRGRRSATSKTLKVRKSV